MLQTSVRGYWISPGSTITRFVIYRKCKIRSYIFGWQTNYPNDTRLWPVIR